MPVLVSAMAPQALRTTAELADGALPFLTGQRALGAAQAADLALIGDEETVAARVQEHFDAGATEVVLSQTGLAGDATRRLGGELARKITDRGAVR
ncbi:hypothetical protein [Allokutzneria oryzae]|uniref:LLM class flavin-dependent oxidoreductase n=1 Tax=Allokutzneria oryzae TaxID=1378989 RepID=A0ABV5ZRR6_9PSEU